MLSISARRASSAGLIDAGGARIIVNHDRDFDRLGDAAVVLVDLSVSQRPIRDRNDDHRVGADIFCKARHPHCLIGGQRAGAGHYRNPAIDVLGADLNQLLTLFFGERAVRAGAAENSDAVHAVFNLPVKMRTQAVEINCRTIVTGRRRGERENTSQSLLCHRLLLSFSEPVLWASELMSHRLIQASKDQLPCVTSSR